MTVFFAINHGEHNMQRTLTPLITTAALILAATVGFSLAGQDAKGSLSANVLIVGGGTHHNFQRWFNKADTATLEEAGAEAEYTDKPKQIPAKLDQGVDVLCLTNNKPMPGKKLRKRVFDFVDEGNGLVLVHASIWYNWKNWPRYNRELVAGGSRSHPPLGEAHVEVNKHEHPVMEGVPSKFKIIDELYRYKHDPKGPDITVLATGTNPKSGKSFPVVWTVHRPDGGRIVCTTLGHDGRAHNHPAYKAILRNAVRWANPDRD